MLVTTVASLVLRAHYAAVVECMILNNAPTVAALEPLKGNRMDPENKGVVQCSTCGKTTTDDKAFPCSDMSANEWICEECLLIKEAMLIEGKRIFGTGATRDTNKDKLAYDKGLSVQVLQAYMEYLGKHRVMKDGSLRDWSNWKKGIPVDTYRESLERHAIDALRKSHGLPLREEMSLEDLLCAVIFNASGWLFELLVKQSGNREGA